MGKILATLFTLGSAFSLLICGHRKLCAAADANDWPAYGRDAGGMRFSPLTNISPANVQRLKVAWTFRTGELETYKHSGALEKAAFEATPLAINGVLYLSTPTDRVFALAADTQSCAPNSAIMSWPSHSREINASDHPI